MWWRDLFGKVARGDAACFLCGPGRVWRWLRAMSFCHVLERVQPLEKDGTRARDHNTPETTKHTVAPAPLSARAAIVKRDAQALERGAVHYVTGEKTKFVLVTVKLARSRTPNLNVVSQKNAIPMKNDHLQILVIKARSPFRVKVPKRLTLSH